MAVRALRQELAPGGPEDFEHMTMALGRQIGLLKAGLAAEHKEDWISIALEDLAQLPPDMVIDALREVRRRARFEGDVLPMVLEIIDPRVAALRTEQKHVERLIEIAE